MRHWFMAGLATFLLGCQSLREPPGLIVLAPLQIKNTTQVLQSITLKRELEENRFTAVLLLQPSGTSLVAMTLTGQILFKIRHEQEQITFDSPVGLSLPGERIMSLVQLALWPLDALQPYQSGAWQLIESDTRRQLYYRKQQIVDIRRSDMRDQWPYHIQIDDHQFSIELTIQTLQQQVL